MSNNNQIQVMDTKEITGMRITKGNQTVEISPEVSQHICEEMIHLGMQLIAEVGQITVEYFKTQSNMYYEELNAYIRNQTLKSEERREILNSIKGLTDKYAELINKTDDIQKREILKSTYEFFSNQQANLYIRALAEDMVTKMPEKTNLLSGLFRVLRKK